MKQVRTDIAAIASQFQVDGKFVGAIPYGSGYINETYASRFQTRNGMVRYIHQRINHHVFHEPEKLMENVERVIAHARARTATFGGDPLRETMTLIPVLNGKSYYKSPEGEYWRTYLLIEGARSFDQMENSLQLYHAGHAFGRFLNLLSDLPGPRLHETIPNFHNTRKRFDDFVLALERDRVRRALSVRSEIEFVLARERTTSVVLDMLDHGTLPERVIHNDTKLNNVLMDERSGQGLCVVDLDTVMPGSALYDFGDMVRAGATAAAEDDRDLDRVSLELDRFDALLRGYLDGSQDLLTPDEIKYLPFSAYLITLEQAIRFLADYINGDVYYKIRHPGHNLDRTRTQIKLAQEMEAKMDVMKEVVRRYRRDGR